MPCIEAGSTGRRRQRGRVRHFRRTPAAWGHIQTFVINGARCNPRESRGVLGDLGCSSFYHVKHCALITVEPTLGCSERNGNEIQRPVGGSACRAFDPRRRVCILLRGRAATCAAYYCAENGFAIVRHRRHPTLGTKWLPAMRYPQHVSEPICCAHQSASTHVLSLIISLARFCDQSCLGRTLCLAARTRN
jgi:hypothetical protein